MIEIICFTTGCAMSDEKEKNAGVASPKSVNSDGSLSETPPASDAVDITLGALQSGKSKVSIPLECFGDSSSDVDSATIDVAINDTAYVSDIDAGKYYHSSEEAVVFYLSGLESGDTISLDIKSSSSQDTYSGNVGDSTGSATLE
jgi:hypothetical protein